MATLFITWILRLLLSNIRLPPSLIAAETSLYGGRRWETLSARVCGSVWEGWRPAPAQQPTASSSSNILLTFISLSHVHTRSVTQSKPLTVKMNNSYHLTTVKYSAGQAGSWHPCGCYFSQPICPNTLVDPPSPYPPWYWHIQWHWSPSRTIGADTPQNPLRNNLRNVTELTNKIWPQNATDLKVTGLHGCADPWMPLGSAVGMEGFFKI